MKCVYGRGYANQFGFQFVLAMGLRRKRRYQKGKRNNIIIFRSVDFAGWFVGIERCYKFAPKPF